MPFEKGNRANPGGRPKDKAFADAVRLVVNRTHDADPEKRKKLMVLAEKLVECGLAGEPWAIQQVADRLDGKPVQESNVNVSDKRDATDWTRGELVAVLDDAPEGSGRTAAPHGRGREPDSVH